MVPPPKPRGSVTDAVLTLKGPAVALSDEDVGAVVCAKPLVAVATIAEAMRARTVGRRAERMGVFFMCPLVVGWMHR